MVAKLTIAGLLHAVKECRLTPAEESIQQYGLPKNTKKTTDYLVLQTAVEKNHKSLAKLLINAGCRLKPNETEKDNGWTPLAWTVIRGNVETAMQLLNKGAPPEAGNKTGLSVLHLAVRKKSLRMVRLLLCYMSVNLVDSKGKSLLQTFFQVVCNQINLDQEGLTNNEEILELLLAKGASLNFQNDPLGYTPMHYAVKSKQVGLMNKMIQKTGNVNVRSSSGDTPLHVLLSDKNGRGVLDVVRLLVRNGANVNITNNQGENLLHVVLARCHGTEDQVFELIQFLVERGTNINAQNLRNESACHLAARKKCLRVLHLFLRHQCQINLQDHENNTVLHRLLQNSRNFRLNDAFVEVVNGILALRPSLEDRNSEGKTPLDLVIQSMQTRLLGRLLAENVNINAVDDHGNTPLHGLLIDLIEKKSQITPDHLELIEILSSSGSNVDLANNVHKTPVQLALDLQSVKTNRREQIFDVLLLLLNHTNDLDSIVDAQGKPMLHSMSSLKKPFAEAEDAKAAEIVDVCLAKGAAVDLKDRSGVSALCMAATNKQEHVAKVLLRRGADPNSYIPNSQATVLECLLRMNDYSRADVEIAGALLSRGAVIDETPGSEFSLLNYVTLPNKFEMCSKLISHSKNVDAVDDRGNTALHKLLQSQGDASEQTEGRVCKVASELVLKGDSINAKNDEGLTPLHLAVKHKLYRVTEDLLARHAEPAARDNQGNCALHFLGAFPFKAGLEFARGMVKLLTGFGCDVNAGNNSGATPLAAAVILGSESSTQALIENEADVNLATSDDSRSPLHLAAELNRAAIGQWLVKRGADVNARRGDGKTALHVAVVHDAVKILKILLRNGADADAKDRDGRTAILLACWYSKHEAAKKLLDGGADVDLADDAGKLPLELANGATKTELVRHIRKLAAAGVELSGANSRINLVRDELHEEYAKEVERMREAKLDGQRSLADVLRMSRGRLATFKNNEEFQRQINAADLQQRFPHYADLLRACYTRGAIRSDLLARAKISFRDLLEMPLPDLCCDLLFGFLSNDDLQELTTAARLKSQSRKRQRDDEDEDDGDGPPAKRLRRLSV